MLGRGLHGLALLGLGVLLAAAAIACGGDSEDEDSGGGDSGGSSGGGGAISVSLKEWEVKPARTTAKAGELTFKVDNKGATPHELAVIKTDSDVAKLPQASGLVDEKQLKPAGRTKNLEAGKSESLKLKLEPGKYALICNIAAHYGQGMHAAFTVE
jgi:uncharacterized cupredoxin-like copper-binding protein